MRVRESIAVTVAWPLAGCGGWQSALDAHGSAAAEIKHLFFVFLAVAAAVWITVLCVLLAALIRGRQPRPDPLEVDQAGERRAGHVIFGCAVATTLIVLVLSVLSYISQSTVFAKSRPARKHRDHRSPVVVGGEVRRRISRPEVHDRQRNPRSGRRAGRVKLETADVIHSFWVPSLLGQDGPDHRADRTRSNSRRRSAGVYRGQCAEFCGLQHAHMGLTVIALPPRKFDAVAHAQIAVALQPPNDPRSSAATSRFDRSGCAVCHTIRGTPAGGKLGPDLTHLASRRTIAAGTLPMTPGNLAAWIADPQHIKPGNLHAGRCRSSASELDALVRYLESLK